MSTAKAFYHIVQVIKNFNIDSQSWVTIMEKELDFTLYQFSAFMKELNLEGETQESSKIFGFESMFESLIASADMFLEDFKFIGKRFQFDQYASVFESMQQC